MNHQEKEGNELLQIKKSGPCTNVTMEMITWCEQSSRGEVPWAL